MHRITRFESRNPVLFLTGVLFLAILFTRISFADTGGVPVNPGHPLSQTWIDTDLNTGSYNIYTTSGNISIGATNVYRRGASSGSSLTCAAGQYLQSQVVSGGIVTGGNCIGESDPTVPLSVKDGVSWTEIGNRPSYNCNLANQSLKSIDLATGAVTCEIDDVGAGGGGTPNILQVLQSGSDAFSYAGTTMISGVIVNNLTSGRAIEAVSPTGDGVMGKTNAAGRSGVYGWSTNAGSYAGYFEGGLGLKVVGNADWTGYSLTGGSVPWARLTGFPAACPAGQFATQAGGTLTCAAAVTSVGYGTGLTSTTAPNPITASGTLSLSINSGAIQTCAGTQKVSSLSPAGIITCSNDVDTNSGGDITDVFAGTGISGGGSAGAVTLSLNTLGISTCTDSVTNKIYWDSTNSRLTCGTDQTGAGGGVSSVTGSIGVTASPTTGAVGVSLANPSKACGAGTAVQSFDLSNANAPVCVSVGGVTGSGTQNYVSKWGAGGTSIGNSMIYDTGANIGIGTANPTSILPYTKFLVASSDPLSSDIGVVLATAGGQPAIQLARARGSIGAPSIVQNGDALGEIVFGGYDGSDYMVGSGVYAARIISEVDGTPGLNNIPARFSFQTTSAGTYFDRMRITSSGNVGISSVNPGSRLTINGGDVYVSTSGNGIILKDTTDGTCRRIVLTSGALSLSGTMTCPSS